MPTKKSKPARLSQIKRKRSLMIVCGPPANGKRASKAIARMQFTIIGGRQEQHAIAQVIRSRAADERATRGSQLVKFTAKTAGFASFLRLPLSIIKLSAPEILRVEFSKLNSKFFSAFSLRRRASSKM